MKLGGRGLKHLVLPKAETFSFAWGAADPSSHLWMVAGSSGADLLHSIFFTKNLLKAALLNSPEVL